MLTKQRVLFGIVRWSGNAPTPPLQPTHFYPSMLNRLHRLRHSVNAIKIAGAQNPPRTQDLLQPAMYSTHILLHNH